VLLHQWHNNLAKFDAEIKRARAKVRRGLIKNVSSEVPLSTPSDDDKTEERIIVDNRSVDESENVTPDFMTLTFSDDMVP
jgi:hypothetical protein